MLPDYTHVDGLLSKEVLVVKLMSKSIFLEFATSDADAILDIIVLQVHSTLVSNLIKAARHDGTQCGCQQTVSIS